MTRLLSEWQRGGSGAENDLFEALYPQLTTLARRFLADEHAAHTLEPGVLVHELWIRLTAGEAVTFDDRTHFFAVAAKTMRRILVDHARARLTQKRGGNQERVSLSAVDGWNPVMCREDLLSLDEALSELEGVAPRAARVVELRFFGGLRGSEISVLLGISEVSVKRDSRVALAWLASRLGTADRPRASRSDTEVSATSRAEVTTSSAHRNGGGPTCLCPAPATVSVPAQPSPRRIDVIRT